MARRMLSPGDEGTSATQRERSSGLPPLVRYHVRCNSRPLPLNSPILDMTFPFPLWQYEAGVTVKGEL